MRLSEKTVQEMGFRPGMYLVVNPAKPENTYLMADSLKKAWMHLLKIASEMQTVGEYCFCASYEAVMDDTDEKYEYGAFYLGVDDEASREKKEAAEGAVPVDVLFENFCKAMTTRKEVNS